MQYKIATKADIELLLESRLETLRDVNHLDANYHFDDSFVETSRQFFLNGDQTTVLATEDGCVVGCATMCYLYLMPTFSHPSGQRAHLMNVYTNPAWRRKGIARHMISLLIEEAWNRGVTEISLDATQSGRPLYQKCGFTDSEECMVLEKRS